MPIFEGSEQVAQVRVVHRLARGVGHEVLLGHVGHVGALLVLGEEVVEGLVAAGAAVLGEAPHGVISVSDQAVIAALGAGSASLIQYNADVQGGLVRL